MLYLKRKLSFWIDKQKKKKNGKVYFKRIFLLLIWIRKMKIFLFIC